MNEFNLLDGYPSPSSPRLVSSSLRTINHRIIASKRDKRFFDGERNFGYGGYKYDGRWQPIAKKIITHYSLFNCSKVLQMNAEKGFLLKDLKDQNSKIDIYGTETSQYAIDNSIIEQKDKICISEPTKLPFNDNYFDFVIALGVIYTLNLKDAITAINEITRVSKKHSFITLASYESEKSYFLFKDWTLLGTTILKKEDWKEILLDTGYTGDYFFTNAESLNLKRV